MSLDDEAEALRVQLQMCAAGHTIGVTWRAASDHFAGIIGFAANDRAHADELVEAAARDMRSAIRRNWDELRRNREAALSGGGAGHG